MTIAILCHAVVRKGVCQITDSELDQHSEGFTTAIKYMEMVKGICYLKLSGCNKGVAALHSDHYTQV